MSPKRKLDISKYPGVRSMKIRPAAMPTDQMAPITVSSLSPGINGYQTRDNGSGKRRCHGTHHGIQPGKFKGPVEIKCGSNAPKGGMGDGPGKVTDAFGHHIGADDAKRDAGQKPLPSGRFLKIDNPAG